MARRSESELQKLKPCGAWLRGSTDRPPRHWERHGEGDGRLTWVSRRHALGVGLPTPPVVDRRSRSAWVSRPRRSWTAGLLSFSETYGRGMCGVRRPAHSAGVCAGSGDPRTAQCGVRGRTHGATIPRVRWAPIDPGSHAQHTTWSFWPDRPGTSAPRQIGQSSQSREQW
jgi:hypothetical protein